MRVKLAIFIVLLLGLMGSALGIESCRISLDCSSIPAGPGFVYAPYGYVSAQGHFSNRTSSLTDFPYRLCCPNFIRGRGGNLSFRFSEFNPPINVNNSHVSTPNTTTTSFGGLMYLGTDYCHMKTSCYDNESCIFKMSNSDNAHVADCNVSNVPMSNLFVQKLCCKISEICWDGIDNDRDGYTDCADADCFGGLNGSNFGKPQLCTDVVLTNQSSWMNTSACALSYNRLTNTTVFNASCLGQPLPANTHYYCGFGKNDDPTDPPGTPGVCCAYGTRPAWNALSSRWECLPSAECGVDPLLNCKFDFDLTKNLFYPNTPPHWLNLTYLGDPSNWCNSQIPNLFTHADVTPYAGSNGCCLIPKYGEINYWLDKDNVRVWG